MGPLKEGVFQSTMVATTLQIILNKISMVVMGSHFFSSDTTSQTQVKCGLWGIITMGSLRGLIMAWVVECPGVIQPFFCFIYICQHRKPA
jgi:hypothetical protein